MFCPTHRYIHSFVLNFNFHGPFLEEVYGVSRTWFRRATINSSNWARTPQREIGYWDPTRLPPDLKQGHAEESKPGSW
jgi:hypothetical protein